MRKVTYTYVRFMCVLAALGVLSAQDIELRRIIALQSTSPRTLEITGVSPNETLDVILTAGDDVDDDVRLGWLNSGAAAGYYIRWDQSADTFITENNGGTGLLELTDANQDFHVTATFDNTKGILWEDSVGTAATMLEFTSSDWMTIGPTSPVNGSGDLIFYRDGTAEMKLTSDVGGNGALTPDVDQTNRVGREQSLWARGHFVSVDLGRSTTPAVNGSLVIHSTVSNALTLRNRDEDTDGSAELELILADFIPALNGTQKIGHTGRRWDGFFDVIDVNSCIGCGGASLPVVDTTSIVEGSADATKEIRFEVDGLSTGTVRVLTPQNANYTLAGTNITNEFSVDQRWSNNTKIFFEDTLGTAITTFWLDSSNFLNIGTVDGINGSGDVVFYRDGSGVAKFSQDAGSGSTFEPDVDQTNRVGDEGALWARGHFVSVDLGRSTSPAVNGSLLIHSTLASPSTLRTRDEDSDGSPELELTLADFIPALNGSQEIGHTNRRWDGFFDDINAVDITTTGQIWSQSVTLPIRSDNGYQDGSNVGIDRTCAAGETLTGTQVSGGIIVAGTCTTN